MAKDTARPLTPTGRGELERWSRQDDHRRSAGRDPAGRGGFRPPPSWSTSTRKAQRRPLAPHDQPPPARHADGGRKVARRRSYLAEPPRRARVIDTTTGPPHVAPIRRAIDAADLVLVPGRNPRPVTSMPRRR
jgi:hypothetical protein